MYLVQTQDGEKMEIPSKLKCYEIIEEINKGCSSVVFKVQQIYSKKIFAAKVISTEIMQMKNQTSDVENEIKILRSLNHPNIIKIYDIFQMKNDKNDEFKVIIEEYCSNGNMFEYILNNKLKSEYEKKKIMKNIIDAISYIHKKGIAHCDIKLENILFDDKFNVKLCDFGFAKDLNKEYDKRKCGSPEYASPELFSSGEVDFIKSDIWSLGITLFAIETRCFPYENISEVYDVGLYVTISNQKLSEIFNSCFDLDPKKRIKASDILDNEYFSNDDQKLYKDETSIFVSNKTGTDEIVDY